MAKKKQIKHLILQDASLVLIILALLVAILALVACSNL